ncbi:hypothetical protein QT352_25455 (plasmid) [Escherichia coli]|nr:hypothetical protein [Escherichia coli]
MIHPRAKYLIPYLVKNTFSGKTKAAKAEVERNGYKVWEPKKER